MQALSIPPAALRDPDAVELARIWIAERGLHCSIKVGMYAESGASREISAWGIILADITHHLAAALEAEGLGVKADLKERLVEAFQHEISTPSSDHATKRGTRGS
jgi:hypothetical protein